MLRRVGIVVVSCAALVVPAGARADTDVIATFSAPYDLHTDSTASEGPFLPLFSASASDWTDGEQRAVLTAQSEFMDVTGPVSVGPGRPYANASAGTQLPSVNWVGPGVRLEARFAFDLRVEDKQLLHGPHTTNTAPNDFIWPASVDTYLDGEGVIDEQSTWDGDSWIPRGEAASILTVGGSRYFAVKGEAVASTTVRVPCAGTTLDSWVGADIPTWSSFRSEPSFRHENRSVRLDFTLLEVTLVEVPSLPCYETQQIEVHDSFFDPADVSVAAGTIVRMKWTDTQLSHNVDFGFEGQTWFHANHDFEEMLREPGEYTYFCTIHGSANGTGMAGRILVT